MISQKEVRNDKGTLPMLVGSGDNAFTYYNCGVVEEALKSGKKILVVKHNKSAGTKRHVSVDPHLVHRKDITDVYGPTHDRAGQGKYIDNEAWDTQSKKSITGAQYVNPFLPKDGWFYAIVNTLRNQIDRNILSKLSASLSYSRKTGHQLLWDGDRNEDGFIDRSCTEWMTADEIYNAVCKSFPGIVSHLKKKDGELTPREKFDIALNILTRTVETVDVSTGEVEYMGGATPFGKPMEQVGFAIDRRYLTYDVSDGEEHAQYYYRFVVGRSRSHNLMKSSWAYESKDSIVCFLNEDVRNKLN